MIRAGALVLIDTARMCVCMYVCMYVCMRRYVGRSVCMYVFVVRYVCLDGSSDGVLGFDRRMDVPVC